MTREELETTVIRFMDSFTTMTLACSLDDQPWASPVYYARQGLDLVFFSSPKSRHSEIYGQNPWAAASIHGECKGWKEIKGLQMEGRVQTITSPLALAKATATFLRRYTFVREFLGGSAALSQQIADKMTRVALYVFCPSSIRYLDNSADFGTRWKLEIQDGRAVGAPILA
ncbi:MAG: pyridoxamine 5'-phosphate oxidase family protein [Deltaproteobacteria bacterium]|nr:pyridoxamine 5'-phosphate oxidase family protein [Deltaproteobacteria bacterium]